MAENRETELAERTGLAVSMSVEDWKMVHDIVSRQYPDIASAIILDLQDAFEGYAEPGPTVELSADEWRKVLSEIEDRHGSENLVAELTFQLLGEE